MPVEEEKIENGQENVMDDEFVSKSEILKLLNTIPTYVRDVTQYRDHFEKTHKIDYHVMGFTVDEWERQKKFSMMERKSLPVLVSQLITKKECFDIISKWGVQLPEMYKLGFKNSNCMGCVKASSPAYWNMIRKYFPDVFEQRVQQSRKHGCKLVVLKQKRIFLDELPNDALGGKLGEWECGLFCDTY